MDRTPAGALAGPDPSDVTWTHVIYALHGVGVSLGLLTSAFVVTGFLFSLPSIAAVIMNYARRDRVRGTYLESHFRWQIRTFWFALLWIGLAAVISVPLMLLVVGFLTLWLGAVAIGIWILYRVARGWLRLSSRLPMYV
jgi:uncharacterized membrane protein